MKEIWLLAPKILEIFAWGTRKGRKLAI